MPAVLSVNGCSGPGEVTDDRLAGSPVCRPAGLVFPFYQLGRARAVRRGRSTDGAVAPGSRWPRTTAVCVSGGGRWWWCM